MSLECMASLLLNLTYMSDMLCTHSNCTSNYFNTNPHLQSLSMMIMFATNRFGHSRAAELEMLKLSVPSTTSSSRMRIVIVWTVPSFEPTSNVSSVGSRKSEPSAIKRDLMYSNHQLYARQILKFSYPTQR